MLAKLRYVREPLSRNGWDLSNDAKKGAYIIGFTAGWYWCWMIASVGPYKF